MILDKSHLLAQVLNKSSALDEKEMELIAPFFQITYLREGDYFIKKSLSVDMTAFVVSGILRRFITSKNGDEITIQFITDEQFCGDLDSYFKHKSSCTNVQAITNCHLLSISTIDLNRISNQYPKVSAIMQFIGNEANDQRIKTEELIRNGSPFEKLQHFLTEYSNLASRIPLKDIASYLKIRPQTLSFIGSLQLGSSYKLV